MRNFIFFLLAVWGVVFGFAAVHMWKLWKKEKPPKPKPVSERVSDFEDKLE